MMGKLNKNAFEFLNSEELRLLDPKPIVRLNSVPCGEEKELLTYAPPNPHLANFGCLLASH